MRKFMFILVFILILPALFSETIKIGIYALEPFMIDNGPGKKPSGINIDYYEKYIAPKMGADIEWVGPLPFGRLENMLQNGELDMLINLTKTDERAAKYIFPDIPQSRIISCLTVKKDNPLTEIKKAEDLFGKRIGYIVTGYIPPLLKNDRITMDLVSDADYRTTNLKKLLADRIDGLLDINYVSMLYFIKINGYGDKVKTLRLPVDPVNVYALFVKSEKGERLAKSFEKIHKELEKAKVFDSLVDKYLH